MKITHYLLRLSWMLLLTGLLAACGNDDDEPAPPTRTELLTGKADWRFTALTSDPPIPTVSGTVVTNVFAQLAACNRDDLYIFRDNGRFIWDEGASKCDDSDPQVFNEGTWTLSADENTIVFNSTVGQGTEEWRILELTATVLRAEFDFVADDGVRYVFTATLN